MRSPDLIVTDLDGTLIDYKLRAYKVLLAIAKMESNEIYSLKEYADDRLMGHSNYEIFRNVLNANLDQEHFDLAWAKLIESEKYLAYDSFFSDSMNWLLNLSQKSTLVLCTARRHQKNLMKQLQILEVADLFDAILIADADNSKIACMQMYVESSSIESREIHVIGDTREDMLAGVSIGAKLHFVNRGFTPLWRVEDLELSSSSNMLPQALDSSE
jgi:phosphoglycolate phosphatase-like HAD superfamily hydrolase